MCGIVGAVTKIRFGLGKLACETLAELAIANTVRGYHGTGVMYLEQKDEGNEHTLMYVKQPVPATQFLSSAGAEKAINGSRFAVFHSRQATMGLKDEEHTHPFSFPAVTGVHNGTVYDWEDALVGHSLDSKMDSAGIFEALSKTDPEPEAVVKVLAALNVGAYSLVWWDYRNKCLRFARNEDRPMYFVNTTGTTYFGSELRMLEWVLGRNKMTPKLACQTKPHVLIDVPVVRGETIQTLDYSELSAEALSKSTFWGRGRKKARGWDNDDYLDADWWEVSRPYSDSYYRSGYDDRDITLRGYASKLPALNTISPEGLDKLNHELSMAAGLDVTVPGNLLNVRKFMDKLLLEKVKDATSGITATLVPVHIVYHDNKRLFGYVIVDGKRVAVTMPERISDEAVTDKIDDINASGLTAVLPRCALSAVRAFHTGDISYVGSTSLFTIAEIEEGEEITESTLGTFGMYHPDTYSYTVKDINWAKGWERKAND